MFFTLATFYTTNVVFLCDTPWRRGLTNKSSVLLYNCYEIMDSILTLETCYKTYFCLSDQWMVFTDQCTVGQATPSTKLLKYIRILATVLLCTVHWQIELHGKRLPPEMKNTETKKSIIWSEECFFKRVSNKYNMLRSQIMSRAEYFWIKIISS